MDNHYNYCCSYNLNNRSTFGRFCGSNRKWVLRDIREIIRGGTLDGHISAFEVTDKDGRVIDRCTYFPKNGFRYTIRRYKQVF